MRRRAVVAVVVALCLAAFAGPAAGAESVSERIARQQAETKAKIACTQAKARGKSCASAKPAAPAATSSGGGSRSSSRSGGAKRIEVSIGEQMLRAYEGDRVFMAVPVSTGKRGSETPTGRFSILSKERMHWSTQFGVWMPYAMRVVRGIFIHELPLTEDGRRLGTSSLGHAVSAGCIRVGVGPAERLYGWAPVGTPVLIR